MYNRLAHKQEVNKPIHHMNCETGLASTGTGTSSSSASSAPDPRLLLLSDEDALQRALDPVALEDKRDFVLALERVPFLVQHESNPSKFLQRENFHVARAVRRLCLYWKYRCEIFGSERAFCPMTLTGDGAFRPEDVDAFCTGIVYPISEGASPALYIDRMRHYEQPNAVRRRMFFYALQLMSEYEAAISPGFTMIVLWNVLRLDTTTRLNSQIFHDGFPVQID